MFDRGADLRRRAIRRRGGPEARRRSSGLDRDRAARARSPFGRRGRPRIDVGSQGEPVPARGALGRRVALIVLHRRFASSGGAPQTAPLSTRCRNPSTRSSGERNGWAIVLAGRPRRGAAPGPAGAVRPSTRTSASAGPFVEELRFTQFFQRAGGKTLEVDFKQATGTLPGLDSRPVRFGASPNTLRATHASFWGVPKDNPDRRNRALGLPQDPSRPPEPGIGASPGPIPTAGTGHWGFPRTHPNRPDLALGLPQRPLRPPGPGVGASPKTTPTARTWRWGLPRTDPAGPDLSSGPPHDRSLPTGSVFGPSPLDFRAPSAPFWSTSPASSGKRDAPGLAQSPLNRSIGRNTRARHAASLCGAPASHQWYTSD